MTTATTSVAPVPAWGRDPSGSQHHRVLR